LTQAAADYRQWEATIRPAVDEAVRRAENAFKAGGASLLLVLETSRQTIDARTREVQLRADLATAWAELERAVGRSLRTTDSDFGADRP
jgi:outer membrane protein TolC